MLPPFYQAIPKSSVPGCPIYTVEAVVAAIHSFLVDPLRMMGLDFSQLHPHFLVHFNGAKQMSEDRISVIRKYHKMALNPELFEFPPTMRQEWFDPEFWEAHQAG